MSANAFRNTTLVTQMMVMALRNELVLGSHCDMQVDRANLFDGTIGNTAYVRRPIHFTATDDATLTEGQLTDIEEATVPVVLQYYKKVAFTLSQLERTLNITELNEKLFIPAAREIAQEVESSIAAQYIYFPNLIGTAGTTPSTMASVVVTCLIKRRSLRAASLCSPGTIISST